MKTKHLYLALLSSCFLVACDQDKDWGDNLRTDKNKQEYDAAACEFGFEDGEQALGRTDSRKKNSYFGKSYDYAKLENILQASAKNTVKYIQSKGVDVFKVESTLSNCQMFSELPKASGDVAFEWDMATEDSDGGLLLGLYLPEDLGVSDKASILMLSDTDRWTLVHEYFHHLFQDSMATADAEVLGQLQSSSEEFIDALTLFEKKTNSENLKLVVSTMNDFYTSTDEILRRSSLEEAAIQAELMDHYKTGQLAYVPEVTYKDGPSYLHSNLSAAEETYLAFQGFLSDIYEAALSVGSAGLERSKILGVKERLSDRLLYIRILKARYPKPSRFFKAFSVGALSSTEPPKKECVHTKRLKETLDSVLKSTGQLEPHKRNNQ